MMIDLSNVIELAEHRPGWLVARVECEHCGLLDDVSVCHKDSAGRLECSKCGDMSARAVYVLASDDRWLPWSAASETPTD